MRRETGTIRRPQRSALAVLITAALVATACGGGGDGDAVASDPPADEQPATTEPADVDAAAALDASDVDPVTLAHPCGPPPTCWFSSPIYVADEFGFFEKYGVDVTIQPMRSGGDIVQATHTGDIDAGHIGSEPFIVGAPRGLDVVAIYGENNQDWILATSNPDIQSCEDMEGKTSASQTPGDARWLVLAAILDSCGVSMDSVTTVDASSDHLGPLVGGVLDTHTLHLDELAEVRFQTGDDWRVIERLQDVEQLHYTMYVVNTDELERNRDGFVRMVAALAEAAEFMNDPANFDDVVDFLTGNIVKQTDRDLAADILTDFLEMEQWVLGEDGLNEQYLSNSIELQAEMGNIPAAYPPSDIVDRSIWQDAWELVEAHRG